MRIIGRITIGVLITACFCGGLYYWNDWGSVVEFGLKYILSPLGVFGLFAPIAVTNFVKELNLSAQTFVKSNESVRKDRQAWINHVAGKLELGDYRYALIEFSIHYYSLLISIWILAYSSILIIEKAVGNNNFFDLVHKGDLIGNVTAILVVCTALLLFFLIYLIASAFPAKISLFSKYIGNKRLGSEFYTQNFWTNPLSLARLSVVVAGLVLTFIDIRVISKMPSP